MTPNKPSLQHFQPVMDAETIAAELHVSRQRVDFILKSGLAKLRAELEKRGIKNARELLPD